MIRRLYLFDDAVARGWHPFALTRPVGELLHGALLLRERVERATGLAASGYLGPEALHGFEEPGAPPVLRAAELQDGSERILLSSRYHPPISQGGGTAPSLTFPYQLPNEGVRLTAEARTVGWILPASGPVPGPDILARPDGGGRGIEGRWARLPEFELPGRLIPDPWTLMAENPDRIAADLRLLFPQGEGPEAERVTEIPGSWVIGEHPVSAGEGVEIDPGVVLDARSGPIHLAAGVRVRGHSRIEGPTWIGAGTGIFGGVIASVSCGPVCKLHGEVDTSIVLGYSNKPHAGYLGHSILGRWVNLGAMTTNSDLKNTYGKVRLVDPEGGDEIDTGLLKMGAMLGDHVRTGIGTLLNTGTVVGAGSNLFGSAMPPRSVPPFSWGSGPAGTVYRKDAFLTTVERVMGRRDIALSPAMYALLARIWENCRGAEGTHGTKGPQGPQGTKGPKGTQGTKGPQGPRGTQEGTGS